MNNRFKFRVWSKETNEFLDNEYFRITGNGNVENFTNENENDQNCIIQQFTGLLDKNGKEIFEGDIVSFFFFTRDQSGKIHNKPVETKALIKYKEDSAEFILEIFGIKSNGWSFGMLMTFVDIGSEEWNENERINKLKLTIIGNIFENPELIKK